jgi:hypothetical protein
LISNDDLEGADMKETELKRCPFCGGEAELYVVKHVPYGFDYIPRCKNPSCCGRLAKRFTEKDTAIMFWNTRKPMKQIVERLEAYRNFEDHDSLDRQCISEAIEIVKEVGWLL